jgi:hypothetical protein
MIPFESKSITPWTSRVVVQFATLVPFTAAVGTRDAETPALQNVPYYFKDDSWMGDSDRLKAVASTLPQPPAPCASFRSINIRHYFRFTIDETPRQNTNLLAVM